MASTTLTFCSTFTSTARLSQKQIHSSTITTTLSLSKTNFSFLSPITPSLSSQISTLSPIISTRSTSTTIPKSSESEAPVLDSEIVTADFEPAQIVETSDPAPKREEIFAVVMVGSRQYIVFPGRFIYTQRLKGANVDDKIILSKVLLVGTKTSTYIGKPVVPNAAVHAVVEEQGLNPKVVVFKYKKKKNYRRNIGHRQPNTRIRITGITGYENSPFVTLDS